MGDICNSVNFFKNHWPKSKTKKTNLIKKQNLIKNLIKKENQTNNTHWLTHGFVGRKSSRDGLVLCSGSQEAEVALSSSFPR